MNHLLWSGVLCLIFSLITLFTYEYRNQEIFDIIFGASLCNLHYSEWCLYMTVNISESWLYCSCIINIVSVLLTATYARQKHSKCKAFSITNQNASMIIFSWHVFAPCCLVPSVLKLLLLWINKYIYDSTNHNILDHRIVYEKGFVLGLYLLILGFACSERIYLFGKQIVDHLLKIFPCLLPIRIVIQSLIMLAYFHVSTMLVWSQVTILYNSYAHLSLTSNIHILIQFLISCLMTSLALILPTLLNVNLLNFEISAISRYFCKIGLLLLSVTVNSMQLDLNLSGTLMYVAAVPTCIFCITWMACLFTCLPFYHTFTFRSLGVLTYQLGNVIYSGLSILSVLFSVMTMINMFPSNLFVYFIFSIFISCIVCLVIWDINNDDSLITGQFQCTYADHESGIMKTSVKNNISPLTNLSSHFVSVSFNNSRSQLALPNMFCDLCIRLILLVCSSVSILGLLTYLVHHFVEVSMNDIVCRLYTVFALKLFCTAQISVGYPQRWLCDKIYCRSTRLFTNSSNDVLRFILISVVNICVVISVILRFQFCSRSSTDIEIFFLPWIIFTLHGKHLNRCRSVFALTCFTILLLYMVFINSPIVKGAVPPLPTFDRQLFGGPSSSFSHWSEFLLTIALCPLHILFLADQSNLSTKVIVDLFFLNRFGIPMKFYLRNHAVTTKSILFQSLFPFSTIYDEISLKPIEYEPANTLRLTTVIKQFCSFISRSVSSVLPQFRLWWCNTFPTRTSTVNYADTFSDGSPTKSNLNLDAFKIIQLIISIFGIGVCLRLMLYLIDQINPTMKEKRECRKRAHSILKAIGLKNMPKLNDYEVCVAVNLVDPKALNTTWNSIGGLDSIINEIKHCVLEPLQAKRLLSINSRLLQPPKGVLLYGPPGCGKTLLARAMAYAANVNFINLQISTLVNMWYGETQKYVEATFTLAEKIQPTIIFIDELDSFLSTRSHLDNEATRMMKTQFMALWDGLLTNSNTQIVIVGATNRPGDLDQAILRRLPFKINVPLPNVKQRIHILKVLLKDDPIAKGLSEYDFEQIANKTEGFSGSDLSELCRKAAFICLWHFIEGGNIEADLLVTVDHFTQAIHKYMSSKMKLESLDGVSFFPLD
ncbi:ATPase family AAA domain-containing protein isoform 3 [Schistosoma japonicum]|nr:ATPase family AAA domain-containing protein isoform 3 [Schistosoma japonicum]